MAPVAVLPPTPGRRRSKPDERRRAVAPTSTRMKLLSESGARVAPLRSRPVTDCTWTSGYSHQQTQQRRDEPLRRIPCDLVTLRPMSARANIATAPACKELLLPPRLHPACIKAILPPLAFRRAPTMAILAAIALRRQPAILLALGLPLNASRQLMCKARVRMGCKSQFYCNFRATISALNM